MMINYGYSDNVFHVEISVDATDYAQCQILRTLREDLCSTGWTSEMKSGRKRQVLTLRPTRSIQMTRQNDLLRRIA